MNDEDFESEREPLEQFMDTLTHDVEPDEWKSETAEMVVITPDGQMDLYPLVMDACLEDPSLKKWKQAFVWRIVEKYGDQATVSWKLQQCVDALSCAATAIVSQWDNWEAEAGTAAQSAQSGDAYEQTMKDRLYTELHRLAVACSGASLPEFADPNAE